MRHKFVSIQYLRGLAAILVLASHALLYPLLERDLAYGRLGWLGVVLFFVISGFIMVVVTGEGRFSATGFLRRRFIRVVPMYWGATLVAAALALLAPHMFKTTVYDTGQLILSLLFVPFFNPVSGSIHPLYKLGWTLNYEVFFYVCFALLAFLEAKARVIWLTAAFVLFAVLGALFQPQAAIPQFYTSFMPLAFCAGAWLGLATLNGHAGMLSGTGVTIALVLAMLGLAGGFAVDRGGLVEDGFAFAGFVAFAAMLVLLAVRLERSLPHVVLLEQIGDASYSIYLVHIYEVAILSGLAFTLLNPADIWADCVVAAVSIAGGTGAGLLVYRFVERPVLNLVSGLVGGRRPARLAEAPAK